MKTMLNLLLLLLILSPAAFSLYQVEVQPLPLNQDVVLTLRLKESNKPFAQQINRLSQNNSTVTECLLDQRNDSQGTPQNTQTITTYTLTDDNKLTVLSETTITSAEGETLQTEQVNFDWDNKKASLTIQDFKKKTVNTKSINLNPKTVLAGSSNYYFQSLIANKIQQDKFTMLTDDGSTYGMTASVSTAPQTISIQGESISCYRVDMKPDLWIFASLFPNMAFYFRTDPPYNFVRYEGPESGVSSPVIVQEVAAP